MSIHSYLVHFGLIWSHLVHFHYIWSTLVQFGSFCPLRSNLFLFSPLLFYSVYLVHFYSIQSIWSTLVLFNPFNLIQSTLVHFGPLLSIRSIFVHLHTGKRQVWIENIYSKSKFIIKKNLKLVISKILSIGFIITILLLSFINVSFRSTLVRLNLSDSLSNHEGYKYTVVIFKAVTHLF